MSADEERRCGNCHWRQDTPMQSGVCVAMPPVMLNCGAREDPLSWRPDVDEDDPACSLWKERK